MPATAGEILNRKKVDDERWILSCDGGGIRGMISLRCLGALENFLGCKCIDLFEMFAGTSTGALIAGALASGKYRVEDLIDLYRDRRGEIFSRTGWSRVFGRLATKYKKKPVHRLLRELLDELRLEDCKRDVLITATDTVKSETLYFSSFRQSDASSHGTFKRVRLRDAMEASMSAPTYFPPHGRFIDGGVGVYNNPCYAAAVEALRYSFPIGDKSKYAQHTVRVFAFGTGAEMTAMKPGQALSTSNLSWISYVIGEGMDEARTQQSYVSSEELEHRENKLPNQAKLFFYRYQVVLSRKTLLKLGVQISDDFDPGKLVLDAIDEDSFAVLDDVGRKAGAHFAANSFFWKVDQGHWERIVCPPQLSRGELEKELQKDYLPELLSEFDRMDEELG